MHAIDDDADPAVAVFQRSAHCARLTALQRRHRVVQVGEAAYAGIQAGADLFVRACGMAGGHDHATFDQRTDGFQWHALRRQRQQRHAVVQRRGQRDLFFVRHAELAGIVRALARRRDVGPFQMDADHARHALRDGLAHRTDGFAHHRHVIADQRGQHRGGTEAAVCLRDGTQRGNIGRVVEQRTAPIDLHVDEAGQQPAAAQVHLLGSVAQLRCGVGQQRADATLFDHHSQIVAEFIACQDAGIAQHGCHHTVSVTLFRCGGRSGLKPRRSASALIAR